VKKNPVESNPSSRSQQKKKSKQILLSFVLAWTLAGIVFVAEAMAPVEPTPC
jgi:hypothetical protein